MPLLPENRVIQSLWIGSSLSAMEQLGIASHIAHGHEFHLYAYDEIQNVPRGTVMKDAAAILPASRIFMYKSHASYAGFANFFRYKLLHDKGGWWSDTDSVCIRPLEFAEDHVFSSEFSKGVNMVNNGVIKAPSGSELMRWAWESCDARDTSKLEWGETGPSLMAEGVRKFGLDDCIQPHTAFCPIGYKDWRAVLDPGADLEFGDETYAVHLWNEQWRSAGADKDEHHHPGCFYERARRAWLGDTERISLERIAKILGSLGD